MKTIRLILIQLLVILLISEVIFRLFGYQPYQVEKYSLVSEPSGYMLPDEVLGFRLGEGTFDVTINDSVNYIATHDDLGSRITKLETTVNTVNDSFWVKNLLLGGSFPYGMGVNDSLSYPFLIQKELSSLIIKVQNACIPGYGMTQSLLQLDTFLKKDHQLQNVILHYASFYDDRNALTPDYRVALHHGFMNSSSEARQLYAKGNYPYIKKVAQDSFKMAWQPLNKMYRNWWLREYSAGINFLQTTLDQSNPTFSYKNDISKWIIQELNEKYCEPNGIHLIIATITNNEATDQIKAFCTENDIDIVDLFVDYSNPEYSNLPYDSHPNAKAHQMYADKMKAYLETVSSNLR